MENESNLHQNEVNIYNMQNKNSPNKDSMISNSSNDAEISNLRRKINAANKMNSQLAAKEDSIKKDIEELNENAEVALKILEERKSQLQEEHDLLCESYDSYPSIDFLSYQSSILSDILGNHAPPNPPSHVLFSGLQSLGLIQSEEDLNLLEFKLKALVNKLEEKEEIKLPSNVQSEFNSPEENELRRRIQLLKTSFSNSIALMNNDIEKSKIDVHRLKRKVDVLYSKLFLPNNRDDQETMNFEEKVKYELEKAGGNLNQLVKTQTLESSEIYQYKTHTITVFQKYDELFGSCDETEFPLFRLFKVLDSIDAD